MPKSWSEKLTWNRSGWLCGIHTWAAISPPHWEVYSPPLWGWRRVWKTLGSGECLQEPDLATYPSPTLDWVPADDHRSPRHIWRSKYRGVLCSTLCRSLERQQDLRAPRQTDLRQNHRLRWSPHGVQGRGSFPWDWHCPASETKTRRLAGRRCSQQMWREP